MYRLRRLAQGVADLEIWLALVLVLTSTVSTRFLLPAVSAFLGLALIRWVGRGRLSIGTAGDLCVGLLLLMLPVTLWASAQLDVTLTQVFRFLVAIAFYVSVANWTVSVRQLRTLWFGVPLLGLGLALAAVFSVEWVVTGKLGFIPSILYSAFSRRLSDSIHPNVMAGVLVVLLPCVLASCLFMWSELKWPIRMLLAVSVSLMLVVLVLSKSRGGLLAATAAGLALVVLRWRRGWLAIPAAVLFGGLLLLHFGTGQVVQTLSATQSLIGLDNRIEVWARAVDMVHDFPFTGIGMGTFEQVVNPLLPYFVPGTVSGIPHAHNLFLQVAIDLGLPGLVAWLGLLVVVCTAAFRVYQWGRAEAHYSERRREADNVGALMMAVGAGILGSQVALAVHGMVDAATWGTRPAFVVWGVWGLAMAGYSLVSPVDSFPYSHKRPAGRQLRMGTDVDVARI